MPRIALGYSVAYDLAETLGLSDREAEKMSRDDPRLVSAAEAAGYEIVDVPDGVDWFIMHYDTMEWVAEMHRTWGGNAECDIGGMYENKVAYDKNTQEGEPQT